jgi:hypothetical protein
MDVSKQTSTSQSGLVQELKKLRSDIRQLIFITAITILGVEAIIIKMFCGS